MRTILLTIFILLGTLAPAGAVAQDDEIVVRGDAARVEIERILDLDNLDTGRLGPREVAEAMDGIARGRAPSDFWAAYRTHVQAWRRLANATEQARRMLSEPASLGTGEVSELAKAKRAIDTTFDEVERIVGRYSVRMPIPRAKNLTDE